MKIYFAHPCFNDKQQEFKTVLLKKMKSVLAHAGLTNGIVLVDPFAHTPNVECDLETKLLMAPEIKATCLRLLDECDLIVALVDGDDTGTAFEAGYAHAMDKPIILVSEASCSSANAMLMGSAQAMIDNVLDEEQMLRLVRTITSLRDLQH
jgi:nucleoside 2-deoxyribosyltransferase